jgi:hypothetical protein
MLFLCFLERAMNIVSKLFKSRDKPKDSTNGSCYRYYFGGTTSGNTVTEGSAMQFSAVYACVRVLSEAIASLPLHLYEYTDEGSKIKAVKHPLYRLFHEKRIAHGVHPVLRWMMNNIYIRAIRGGNNNAVSVYNSIGILFFVIICFHLLIFIL